MNRIRAARPFVLLLPTIVALLSTAITASAAGTMADADAAFDAHNYDEARQIARPLADQGSAEAQTLLGVLYLAGDGVPADGREAQGWLSRAALQGNSTAQDLLGLLYENGASGVAVDLASAVSWLVAASRQNDPLGEDWLGEMYQQGLGVAQDYGIAFQLYYRAARQHLPAAEYDLSLAYLNGQGTTEDDNQGTHLMLESAEHGYAPAQYVCGIVEEKAGHKARAYMWFTLAAKDAVGVAQQAPEKLAELIAGMTPEDFSEGTRLVAAWKPQSVGDAPPTSAQPPIPPSDGEGKQVDYGTAFFVSEDGFAITNAHVVKECARVSLRDPQGMVQPADVVALDNADDLALLKVHTRPRSIVQFRTSKGELGEPVLVYGFPLPGLLASSGNLTTGSITALAGMGDDSSELQLSAPVQPGNSGGPVLDEAGNAVGIVVAKLNANKVASAIDDIPQNVNFAIKTSVVTNFLDAHAVSYRTTKSSPDLPPTIVATSASSFTDQVICVPQ